MIERSWQASPVLTVAFGLVLALGVLAYGLVPLAVYATLRLRADPVRRVTWRDVPAEVRPKLKADAAWLAANGFELSNHLLVDGGRAMGTTIGLWLTSHVDAVTGRMAVVLVSATTATDPQGRPATTHGRPVLMFSTYFDDGTSVNTQDNPDPTTLPKPPRQDELHVTGLPRDELLRLHAARERRRPEPEGVFARSEVRCVPDPDREAMGVTLTMRHDYRELVGLGAMREVGPLVFGQSLGRAYLATWCLLPPVKQILHWRDNAAARRLLSRAEADPPVPPPRVRVGLPRYFDASPSRHDPDLADGERQLDAWSSDDFEELDDHPHEVAVGPNG